MPPRKLGIAVPSDKPANGPRIASLPSLLTIVNASPMAGVWEPLSASTAPVRSTVPATFNCEYPVSNAVPSIRMANSAPAANVTLLAVTSVPAVSGWTTVPGSSASDPPAVCIVPGSKAITPPLISTTSVLAGREIAALTVIAPLAAAPIVSVPAVMRSSSLSVKPSVSGLPASTSSPPKSIRVPAVRGRRTTAFAPASTKAPEDKSMESATRLMAGDTI